MASIFTEKTILIAVIIQVVVAGFSGFLVVGLASLVDPESLPEGAKANVAYVGPMEGIAYLEEEGLSLVRYRNLTRAEEAFKNGEADAILVLSDFAWRGEAPVFANLTLPDGTLRATLTLVQVKGALEALEHDLREARSDRLDREPVRVPAPGGSQYSFVYTLLIPLLVLLPVVLAGALSADSLTEEVQRGTLGVLLTTPARADAIVDGKLFANVALAPLMTIAWLALLAANGLGVGFEGTVWILVLATAGALVFGTLACAVALVTKDRNRAHLVYAVLLFVVIGLSMLLPATPMNAIARFAAGSPSVEAYGSVAGVAVIAVGLYAALKAWLLAKRGDPFAAGG